MANAPISEVVQDGIAVAKADFRAYENARNIVRMADANEVRNRDLTALFLIVIGATVFMRDPADTTSADDGVSVIVDDVGNRWKRAIFVADDGLVAIAEGGTGATTADQARANLGVMGRNRLLNGAMRIAQQGTSFTSATMPANSDDTYLLDQWILLSDGNNIVDVTRQADAPSGGQYAIKLDVKTVDKKFGMFQPIERGDLGGLIGADAILSLAMKVAGSGKLDNVKAAIVYWTGTADTLTSDIVSAWGAEGTNPTLVANWAYANAPVNLNPTTSWARVATDAGAIPSNATNVGVFVWSDVTDTDLGDFLYITEVQLEKGTAATAFEWLPLDRVIQACQRHFEKSYNLTTTIGTNTDAGTKGGLAYAPTAVGSPFLWATKKRAAPTVTLYSKTGTTGKWTVPGGADTAAASASSPAESGFLVVLCSGLTVGGLVYGHWIADARL